MNWYPRISIAEISYQTHIYRNCRIYGFGKRASQMMGTPCFLLESAFAKASADRRAYAKESIPHKIQDLDASGSGGMEGENTTCVSGENPWQNVPNMNFNRNDRKIKLNYNWYDNYNSNWAVASLVRESPSNPLPKKRRFFYFSDLSQPPSMRPISCNCDSICK
jgi:hypothetical protein